MDEDPSASVRVPDGNPHHHLSLADLETQLARLAPAPTESGRIVRLQARPGRDHRTAPERVHLSAARGVSGDRWTSEQEKSLENQVTAIQSSVARLIANGQGLGLFGDNLFVDLDISTANLPAGTRIRTGEATLEVTPMPHDGCRKFRARFGADALRLVARRETRGRNLRGIHLKVVEDGDVCVGDEIQVLRI
jgi:hypothetical protein